jgi:hypothetical protein
MSHLDELSWSIALTILLQRQLSRRCFLPIAIIGGDLFVGGAASSDFISVPTVQAHQISATMQHMLLS